MRWLLVLLCVSACNAPSPYFGGAEVTRVRVEGSVFDVRRKGRLAEAVRVNSEYAPRLGPIARRAEIAMEVVTGCDVLQIRGDAAQILGIMNCNNATPDVPLLSYARARDCEVVDVFVPSGGATAYLEADCD